MEEGFEMARTVRLILEGRRRGVLRLTETENGLSAEAALPGAETVACVSDTGAARARLVNGRAELGIRDVRAAAVGEGGRLIAAGFTGAGREPRTRLFERLRMLLAEDGAEKAGAEKAAERGRKGAEAAGDTAIENEGAEAVRAKAAEREGKEGVKRTAPAVGRLGGISPRSAVSEEVLEMAERLFTGLCGADAALPEGAKNAAPKAKTGARIAEPRRNAVPTEKPVPQTPPPEPAYPAQNPFPKTFPRSEWTRRGEALTGVFTRGGERFTVSAVPAAKDDRSGALVWARRLMGRDGRVWFVEVRREEER